MGVKQKYIEVDNSKFEVDGEFVNRLQELPFSYALQIITQVDCNAYTLPEKDGWAQKVAGVVKDEDPLFFEIEYLKQTGEIPIYISIIEIAVDDYLDYINLNQILSNECI